MSDYNLGLADLLPCPNATLVWPVDGILPSDLTGATVQFVFQKQGDSTSRQTRSATVVSVPLRTVRYSPIASDFVVGLYSCWWVVIFPAGKMRVPNNVDLSLQCFDG